MCQSGRAWCKLPRLCGELRSATHSWHLQYQHTFRWVPWPSHLHLASVDCTAYCRQAPCRSWSCLERKYVAVCGWKHGTFGCLRLTHAAVSEQASSGRLWSCARALSAARSHRASSLRSTWTCVRPRALHWVHTAWACWRPCRRASPSRAWQAARSTAWHWKACVQCRWHAGDVDMPRGKCAGESGSRRLWCLLCSRCCNIRNLARTASPCVDQMP